MKMRTACRNDLDAVHALITACTRVLQARGIDQWGDEYPTRDMIAANIEAGKVYACEVGNELAAVITVGAEGSSGAHADIPWRGEEASALYLNQLAVDPKRQGQGLGNFCMTFAEKLAERRGARSLRLDAHVKNTPLRPWYRRRGYEERGLVAYRNDDWVFAAMEKLLPETALCMIAPPYRAGSHEAALLERVKRIRRQVFVEEQGVDLLIEQDGLDEELEHIVAQRGYGRDTEDTLKAVGCLRFRQTDSRTAVLQRIAVLKPYRDLGLGQKLVREAVETARRRGLERVSMHAQAYLKEYYRRLGFEQAGELFFEAGIPHIMMEKRL
jgi:predicted GNAT family N-acyltransferase